MNCVCWMGFFGLLFESARVSLVGERDERGRFVLIC